MTQKKRTRHVTRFETAEFVPIGRFGGIVGTITWHNLSFNERTGRGSYLMMMAPGASSRTHRHTGAEEFYVLEGSLEDFDGHVYKSGDFVRLDAGTVHTSLTTGGCKLLVTHWGPTETVTTDNLEPLR